MSIYRLSSYVAFPPAAEAEADGLFAVGGDLSRRRLLLAYSSGIFPWFNEDMPLLWWSPEPRCVLPTEQVHCSRRLAKTLRRQPWRYTWDQAFPEVIAACATTREITCTWITTAMQQSYTDLHAAGYAHSLEVWQGQALVGGLYGVAVGHLFCGESMFHYERDASKAALVVLARALAAAGWPLIDCQVASDHLLSLGAREWSRSRFLDALRQLAGPPSCYPPQPQLPPLPAC